jgi:Sec-independent protein secretion pathway component TatC
VPSTLRVSSVFDDVKKQKKTTAGIWFDMALATQLAQLMEKPVEVEQHLDYVHPDLYKNMRECEVSEKNC